MNHRTRVAVLSALAGLPVASSAHAISLFWQNLAGGSANTAGNWSPAQVPTATDGLFFNNTGGTFTVTFNSGTPQSAGMTFGAGDLTLNVTSPHTTGTFAVGNSSLGVITTTLSTGSITASSISSGVLSGTAVKTLNVQGTLSSMQTTGTGDIIVGASGIGRTNITGSATVTSADDVIVGSGAGSDGILTVSGATLFPSSGRSSITTSSTTTGDMIVGSLGAGVMNVSLGALASCSRDMNVAVGTGVNGSVTVGGRSSGRFATVNVLRNLNIASNTTAGTGSGTGSLSLSADGVVTVTGATNVGDLDGGSGSLQISSGTFQTHDLTVDQSNGNLSHTGGTLVVDGGVFTPRGAAVIVNGTIGADAPLLRLDHGASVGSSVTNGIGIVTLANREARLEVLNGSVASVFGAVNFVTAGATNSIASGLVQGVGSTLECTSSLSVANAGTATLDVENGARVRATSTSLALSAAAQATMTLRDNAATLEAGSSINIGGTPSVAGGTATLNILNTASATTTGPVRIYPGGALNITDGSLTSGGTITSEGSINMTNGTITAANFQPQSGTQTSASGRIDAAVLGPSPLQTGTLVVTGPLDIGKDAPSGFNWATNIIVGFNALTVRSTSLARLGDVSLNGGSISAVHPLGMSLANGDSLLGNGTINGTIGISAGATVTASSSNGLTFNGAVNPLPTNGTLNITGTAVTLGSTAILIAAGNIAAKFTAQPGSTITATGNLALGNNSDNFGALLVGATLHVGTHQVTLNDFDGGQIGLCDIAGGSLILNNVFANANLNTANNSFLRGNGTVVAPRFLNLNGGSISPGSSGANGAGLLAFSGTYAQAQAGNTSGTLNIELGGPTPANFDRLQSTGNATLGGTLNLSLINAYSPQPGVFHQIVTSTGGFVLSDFAIKNLPPRFIVLFSPSGYSVGIPCIADVDNGEGSGTPDGGVTIDDLLYYLLVFEAGSIAADVDDGSGTGTPDGGVTIDDLLYYLQRFEAGC